jgi:hypothetical protein
MEFSSIRTIKNGIFLKSQRKNIYREVLRVIRSYEHQYKTQIQLVFKTAIPFLFVFKHLEFFFH